MATKTQIKLSGSGTGGRLIAVTGTDTSGAVAVHTAVAGTTNYENVWIYANNTDTSEIVLTIEWGGTGTGDVIVVKIPAQPSVFFLKGWGVFYIQRL